MKLFKSTNLFNALTILLFMILSGVVSGVFLFIIYRLGIVPEKPNITLAGLFIPFAMFAMFGTIIFLINGFVKTKVEAPSKIPLLDSKQNSTENMPLVSYRDTFSAIVALQEARDQYTSHHSECVAKMTLRYCIVNNFPVLQTQMFEMTAAVHDIGKVGIEDNILRKSGKLEDDEWLEMKTHPEIGSDVILKAGKQLKNVAKSVIAHHERWDGLGYPKGLKGEEIPLAARIIAICDSIDAMLSNRVYRKAMNVASCKMELLNGKGSMYQPELVDQFLENWNCIIGDLYSHPR